MNGALKTYKRIRVFRPDAPNIRRWVLPEERRIYINTAAPDGKIIELRFGKEKEK